METILLGLSNALKLVSLVPNLFPAQPDFTSTLSDSTRTRRKIGQPSPDATGEWVTNPIIYFSGRSGPVFGLARIESKSVDVELDSAVNTLLR